MKNPILRKLYLNYENFFEKGVEIYKFWAEKNKFKDSRRVNIYNSIKLSEEQRKQIDDFYIKNYGRRIPYIFHQYYTAYHGKFDVNYFPEILHAPKFELYMHCNRAYTTVIHDKNILPYIASQAKVKTPKILLSRVSGVWKNRDNQSISQIEFEKEFNNLGEAFIKPSIDSHGGAKCALINIKNGLDTFSKKSTSCIIKELGSDFVVQERLRCHPDIARLYPNSVNTFRVITYQWKDEILHCPDALRIGQGGSTVDNSSAGGMVIAVEEDGALHDTAVTEFNKHYTEHPDTHIVFKDYKIPSLKPILKAAHDLQELIPQVGMCHWDFTLNENGDPVLLEVNLAVGEFGLVQRSHGKGVFGDKTAEILRWTAKMEKLSYTERKSYRFGYMEKQL